MRKVRRLYRKGALLRAFDIQEHITKRKAVRRVHSERALLRPHRSKVLNSEPAGNVIQSKDVRLSLSFNSRRGPSFV